MPACPIGQDRNTPVSAGNLAHTPLALDRNFDFSEEGYDYAGCPKDVVTLININLRRF